MSNPFGEPDDSNGEILEGFLCPICREDLKSFEFLTEHFERAHAEEQDVLKSIFKDIFSKAKKKLRQNFDESFDLSRNVEKNPFVSGSSAPPSANIQNARNTRTRMNVYNFMDKQEVGVERNHLEDFQSVRNPRLERYASETNKLIIRLHKLLKNRPLDPVLRKQHDQNTVVWLDGKLVKLCPSCAKRFFLTRRQHHCRLCGSIMCDDCSKFLQMETAMSIANLTMAPPSLSPNPHMNTIRICDHCLWLLEARQEMQESQNCRPPITQLYTEIQDLRKSVLPDIESYLKIISSLYEGESMFTMADASALRGKIGQIAEAIDVKSKRLLALQTEQGSRAEALKKAIRLSCVHMIKEKMLSLPPLPAEEEIRTIQVHKRMETERRIATERRLAMEVFERSGGHVENSASATNEGYVYGSDLRSLDNWSAHQVSASSISQNVDPLVEQINIIKGYIKQARQDMNFDVVEILENNLRELQREFYERQRSSNNIDADNVLPAADRNNL